MTTQTTERRSFDRPVEFRAAPEGSGSPGTLAGYAAVFNSESRDLGGFVEVIDPGAFGPVGPLDLTVHGRVMCRRDHLSAHLLGTTDAGTLRISVDEVGLWYENDLPDTASGRDTAVLALRGDIRFSSFAFRTPWEDGDEWAFNEQDQLIRRVCRAFLVDVAPVADPAYWDSTSELLRAFDLDAIRASILPPSIDTAPPGDQRVAVVGRAKSMQAEAERKYLP